MSKPPTSFFDFYFFFLFKSFHQCSSANRRGLILALANIGNQHPVWIFCHGFPGSHQWFHCQLHSNLPTKTGINSTGQTNSHCLFTIMSTQKRAPSNFAFQACQGLIEILNIKKALLNPCMKFKIFLAQRLLLRHYESDIYNNYS